MTNALIEENLTAVSDKLQFVYQDESYEQSVFLNFANQLLVARYKTSCLMIAQLF